MKYITTGEAARSCGVGINTVKRWIQKGELQCVVTPGGHWRIAEQEFQHFLKTHKMDQPAAAKRPYKVLLIDDDQPICSLIEDSLELSSLDIEFSCAHDGYTGLMKVGSIQPDLLILDIMLPEINGLELLSRIRKTDLCHQLRVVVITGAGDLRVVKRALEKAAPDGIFYKPFAIAELTACIEQQLESQQLSHSAQPA